MSERFLLTSNIDYRFWTDILCRESYILFLLLRKDPRVPLEWEKTGYLETVVSEVQ